MEGWAAFWKIVLYVGLGLFTVLSLWVIVRGLFDIRGMFAALREEGDGPGDEAPRP